MRSIHRVLLSLLFAVTVVACGSDSGGSSGPGTSSGGPGQTSGNGFEVVELDIGFTQIAPGPSEVTETSFFLGGPFLEEEGLKFKGHHFEGSTPMFQALELGQIDIASGPGTGSLVGAVQEGGEFIGIYSGIPSSLFKLMTRSDSGIKTMADLKGKKVGIISLASDQRLLMENAIVQDGGLEIGDVELLPTGMGLDAMEMLGGGQIHALLLNDGAVVVLKELYDVAEVEAETVTARGFVTATTVTRDFFESNRDVLVRVGRARQKARVFAEENPEAAVRIHWEVWPDSKPVDMSEDAALARGVAQLQARLANMPPYEGLHGGVDPAVIERSIDFLFEGGYLTERLATETFWTDELLEEMNDFDVEAVKKLAREWPQAK